MKKIWPFLKPVLFVLSLIYIGFSLTVYLRPEWFFYHPVSVKPDIAQAADVLNTIQEVRYQTGDGKTGYAWYAKPPHALKAVIFFHGNSYHIGYFLKRVKPFYDAGFAVLMPEYTGFGALEGTPTQSALEQDALGAAAFLKDEGFNNQDIVLYGYSLGTYLAVHTAAAAQRQETASLLPDTLVENVAHTTNETAAQKPYQAVILEAPFTSLADVADEAAFYLFPVKVLIKDTYDSAAKINQIGTRLFIAHGTADQTVPFHHGRTLYEQAGGEKMFYAVQGASHRNLPEHGFFEAVSAWLQQNDTK